MNPSCKNENWYENAVFTITYVKDPCPPAIAILSKLSAITRAGFFQILLPGENVIYCAKFLSPYFYSLINYRLRILIFKCLKIFCAKKKTSKFCCSLFLITFDGLTQSITFVIPITMLFSILIIMFIRILIIMFLIIVILLIMLMSILIIITRV